MNGQADGDGMVRAGDFVKSLEEDPNYLARRRELDAEWREACEKNRLAAAPIVDDLQRAGFTVDSVDELRRSGRNYKAAVPILLKWLPNAGTVGIKEALVRALSVPWANPTAIAPLVNEFRNAPNDTRSTIGLKWAIGNALAIVGDDTVFAELIELVRDKQHGKAREMLVVALGNMKNPAAVDLLIDLLNDPELVGHALMGLAKSKSQKARPHIEPFLNHTKPWVRREAKKALAKLDKK